MRQIVNILKTYILFYISVYIIIFFSTKIILKYFNLVYLSYINILSIIIISLGIVIGTIQIIIKNKNISKMVKIIIGICFVFTEIFIISCVFYVYILLVDIDYLVYRGNKLMIRQPHSVLLSN